MSHGEIVRLNKNKLKKKLTMLESRLNQTLDLIKESKELINVDWRVSTLKRSCAK